MCTCLSAQLRKNRGGEEKKKKKINQLCKMERKSNINLRPNGGKNKKDIKTRTSSRTQENKETPSSSKSNQIPRAESGPSDFKNRLDKNLRDDASRPGAPDLGNSNLPSGNQLSHLKNLRVLLPEVEKVSLDDVFDIPDIEMNLSLIHI